MTSNPGGDDLPGDYSPNGKRVVFARLDHPTDPDGVYVVKVDGTGLRQITPPGTILSDGGGGNDWSPQGNDIVFSQRVTPDARSSLWVVHADGSGLREIHQTRLRYFGPPYPTSTLVAVDGFVHPDALIEITAVAAVRAG